ncbi:phosphogluconate dehydratase, partial [Gammaproteobacteria bacterium]|nr:phosphogluconate dehydratase [Gammaproteobacteria bacterium]
MNSKIIEIQKRIEERSKTLRSDYLNKINLASEHSQSARKNMGCSNIAHAFASCDKAQQGDAADGADVIGIIS